MKILGGCFVLVLAFILGVQTVAVFSWSLPQVTDVVVVEDTVLVKDELSIPPKGIHVMYAGAEPARDDEIAYLRFVVYNGTGSRVMYGSKGVEWPWPTIRVNGRELPEEYRCGSGASIYYIEPNTSAEFRVGVYEFEKVPRENDKITVAFYLRESNADSAEEIFSEPFLLPESFRQAIRLWHKEQEERWR